ncbi:MAG: alcohol dehydrogenase catalytic domain-containing protein [Aigarchaeota archaeon]|nr:alcohol dehydrogenase catalytic domain-containing protein [Aigarchaeota archaeon]MDW8092584.1 alcohol dehydrogenase catalytic domain-containing protein [Nitrososphaerota archaeon]
MKATILKRFQSVPEVVDLPDPLGPGPGEVLVKVGASGICYRDLLVSEGYFPRAKPPLILGHEFAGVVEEVGEGVEWPSKGTRVASLPYVQCGRCYRCISGEENLCRSRVFLGEEVAGCYAERVIVRSRALVELPQDVGFEAGAISACVIGTLLNGIRQAALNPNAHVLVTGGGGGVGIHAVQLAKAMGFSVIAATHSEWKVPAIYGAGADQVLTSPEFSQEAKRTVSEGVDLVIETVGQRTLDQSLRSLRWGGKLLLVGNVDAGAASIQLAQLILRGVSVIGVNNSSRRDLMEALDLVKKRRVRPIISSAVSLESVPEALQSLKDAKPIGRQVVKLW